MIQEIAQWYLDTFPEWVIDKFVQAIRYEEQYSGCDGRAVYTAFGMLSTATIGNPNIFDNNLYDMYNCDLPNNYTNSFSVYDLLPYLVH